MKTYKPWEKVKKRRLKRKILFKGLKFMVIAGILLVPVLYAINWYEDMIVDFTNHAYAVEYKAQENVEMSVSDEIKLIAEDNNFEWVDYLLRLANCESKFDKYAIGDNGKSRGIFQIHSGYHPDITNEQAFNVEFATVWTMNKINGGYQNLWTCDRYIR